MDGNGLAADGLCRRVAVGGHIERFCIGRNKKEPEAFLWVPAHCERLSAVMWSQQNMTEEMLFDMPSFRDSLAEMGVGLIWIAPGIDQQWDVCKGTQKVFDQIMNDLAEVSGYTELREVPLIPFGHSAMATFPWNFAAWNPERTLAVVSFHGMRRAPICAVTDVKTWSGDGRGTLTAFPA